MKKHTLILKYLIPILVILFLIALAIIFIYASKINDNSQVQNSSDIKLTNLSVTRIIDGDTFQLYSGQIVRLICMDTPEKGKKGYEEASNFLSSLILDKVVRLEKDLDDKDAYGRLLRYVYVNNSNTEIFVNKEIVNNDYGTLFPYGNDTLRCNEIAGIK